MTFTKTISTIAAALIAGLSLVSAAEAGCGGGGYGRAHFARKAYTVNPAVAARRQAAAAERRRQVAAARRAQAAKVTVAKKEETKDEDRGSSDTKSNASVLIQQDLSTKTDTAEETTTETETTEEAAAADNSDALEAKPVEKTAKAKDSSKTKVAGSSTDDCQRFIPALGTTITVSCSN